MTLAVSQTNRAAVLILTGMFTLGISDDLARLISAQRSLWQFHMVRGVAAGLGLLYAVGAMATRAWNKREESVMLWFFDLLSIMLLIVVAGGIVALRSGL